MRWVSERGRAARAEWSRRQAPSGLRQGRRRRAMNAAAELIGRSVRCARCGQPITRVIPFVMAGRVRIYGLRGRLVHVAFDTEDALVLRHGYLEECTASGEGGVRP